MDKITALDKEISDLRNLLNHKQDELFALQQAQITQQQSQNSDNLQDIDGKQQTEGLPKWAIERYSRQILLQDIGVPGQQKLLNARVLIVGAGGLASTAALYLAGAGVGEIGIVDYDTVDLSNLHRQILHRECDQNVSKAKSAANSMKNLNSRIKVTPYNIQLDSSNALQITCNYDVVLDCTDNVPTRYMLNDVCVLNKLPLISGSALKMEGQLTIYGYRNVAEDFTGPCYRCLFPTPPPADTIGSCSSVGVAGPVPGVIGCLQALEAIKYIVGHPHSKLLVERMLLFDGEDMVFRTVKLRSKTSNCAACSDHPTVTKLLDYESFCKTQAKEKKRVAARIKAQIRREEKEKRMSGQSYFGFRISKLSDKTKYIQDVPKSERKMGPPCKSTVCSKNNLRCCTRFDETTRKGIFDQFWKLDWREKKRMVRSLVVLVPPKRRRLKLKNGVSRKGDSKVYYLNINNEKLMVCRVMFLNTLGIKEATVRYWLAKDDKPKAKKTPVKSLNVDSYIDNLPKMAPKCQYCLAQGKTFLYLNSNTIKNQFQLYTQYVADMKNQCVNPASRKTFATVLKSKNVLIFKPKYPSDICDLVPQHNSVTNFDSCQNDNVDKTISYASDNVMNVGYYYTYE